MAKRNRNGIAGRPKGGYAYIHSAVDAYSRLAYSEVHENEQAVTAIAFWRRARAFFASYDITELSAIGAMMLERSAYYLSPAAEEALRAEVGRLMTEPHFANARTVRNSLELARLRHAHRVSSDLHREWTRDDLMRLEPVDILEPRSDG